LFLREPLLFGVESAFEFGQAAVAQLGGPVEVVAAFGVLGVVADLFDFGPQFLDPSDGAALGFPLCAHRVGLGPQVGELAA
jgi:hypothetical protein